MMLPGVAGRPIVSTRTRAVLGAGSVTGTVGAGAGTVAVANGVVAGLAIATVAFAVVMEGG